MDMLYNANGSPKLYFVKVDVRTCFDSIEQEKLLEILQRVLSEVSHIPGVHGTDAQSVLAI